MSDDNMDLTKNEIFSLGMETGRQQLAKHIKNQFENGKPIEISGNLYWLKNAKQNLIDLMDDIQSTWNEEHGVKRFIVPLRHPYNGIIRQVIIPADTAEQAMLIALGEFEQGCGWIIDIDYGNYKLFKG